MTEDEMAGWHHRLNGHEFEQAPGVTEGQPIPPSIRVFSNESVFTSGVQSIGASASAAVPPMNVQD